jgi:hypothetical protein
MRISHLVLPALAVTLGATLLAPPDSVGYSTLGTKLNTENERHVRVFDNFTDSEANNNVTPDPDFPGYTGAELAIWKGCTEWVGEPHNNNGLGDPTQAELGSSDANFDIVWQGNATAVGGIGDNVHSALGGGTGGTLAFTESAGDGWRIRYYEDWVWHDGPGSIPFGGGLAYDLQSVAAHEYGHALGLDHSTDGGATMWPSTAPGSETGRSINADDQAGAQFIYDVLDLTKKAHIDSISQSNGLVTITGTMFSVNPGQNEVWFTPAVAMPGNSGTAVKVTGLSSSGGGTVLVCPVPAAAGPGDLIVRNQDITGPKGLSNAMAFVPDSSSCTGSPQSYCTAGTSASGCQALLSSTGVPSATALSGFVVSSNLMEGQKDGLYFFAENGQQANPWGNGSSYQCVTPPVKRTPLQNGTGTIGGCDGSISLDMNAYLRANPQKDPGLGAVVQIQLWYRDPASTSNQSTSMSDGLEFVICE